MVGVLLACVLLAWHRHRQRNKPPVDDYYAVLDVSPQATTAEIRTAYLAAARRLHPDKTSSPKRAGKGGGAAYVERVGNIERRTHPRELCPGGRLPASADCALALRRLAWELKIKCKEVKP